MGNGFEIDLSLARYLIMRTQNGKVQYLKPDLEWTSQPMDGALYSQDAAQRNITKNPGRQAIDYQQAIKAHRLTLNRAKLSQSKEKAS